jgi:hypothetical protein
MDEMKKLYESKLKASQWARKWLIVPSCFLSGSLLLFSLLTGKFVLMWVAIFGFNLVNLWFNSQMQKLYSSALNNSKESDQQARIRALNPHRK